MTTQDSSTYWKRARVELRAAGFDPDRAAQDQRGGDDRQRLDQCASLQQPRARHRRSAGRDPGRARRAGAGRRRAGGVGCADAGHADGGLQPRLARHRRRLLRDRPLRPSRRRHDRDLRLRQDRRRRADAAGAHQCVRARALSRHQHAGPRLVRRMGRQGQQHHDPRLRRGARRQRVRPPLRRGASGSRAQRDARQRHLRRDVHGQHHEHDRGIDRHDAAARRLASGRLRRRQRYPCRRPRAGPRLGRRAVPIDGGRHPAARHHDRAGVRERDHDRLRDGRLDQHVSASARGRARGAGADHDRTHPSRSASASRCSPICSRTARSRWAACMRSAACRS